MSHIDRPGAFERSLIDLAGEPFDWAASNARLDQSLANTAALIDQMHADHAADAVFQEQWNAMTYREAVAFQIAIHTALAIGAVLLGGVK